MKKKGHVLLTALCLLIAGVWYIINIWPQNITVHIYGAVLSPGAYVLPKESLLSDLIAEAGGASEDADFDDMDLFENLRDNQHITIPRLATSSPDVNGQTRSVSADKPVSSGSKDAKTSALISINTATAAELEQLPGIGAQRAKDIIAYREQNGPFQTIDAVKEVSGIGEKIFEGIKDSITV